MKKRFFAIISILLSGISYSQIIPKIKSDTVKLSTKPVPNDNVLVNPTLPNPGFEDGLLAWTAKGAAFSKQVGGEIVASQRVRTEMLYDNGGIGGDYWKTMPFPIGTKGQRWMGSFEAGNGEGSIGSLESAPFKMDRRYLHFLMGGTRTTNMDVKIYVELQTKETSVAGIGKTADGYTRLKRLTPAINSDELFRYYFDLTQLLNLSEAQLIQKPPTMRILIVDSSTSGHLNVDDFHISNCFPDFLKVQREGKTMLADKDHPVWGFADTHAHPMANVAFGGRTMTGDPDGPMASALGNDVCILNGHQPNATGINPSLAGWVVIQGYDNHGPEGYPTFGNWPRFDVELHQPMYIDWIKRSYQGGLRLLSVLGVTNMFWATRALGVGVKPELPIDDEGVLLLAIQKFKEIVGRNSSWMEIALTPQDARRIILENKLAIVLGCEMDNFGNFKDASYKFEENYPKPPSTPLFPLALNPDAARTQIKDKIRQYYNLGLRQFTAMHYISGVFGGTAVFRHQFGFIEASFTGKPFVLKEGKDQGVDYHFFSDDQAFQAFASTFIETLKGDVKGFGTCDPNGVVGNPGSCDNLHSTVNAIGLSDRGKILYEEFMNAGVVIDADHLSNASQDDLIGMAAKRNYPLLSSHSDPRETCLSSNTGERFNNNDGHRTEDLDNYGTSNIFNISSEFTPSRRYYQSMANSGGMAGLFTLPYKKKQWGTQVANDCDGSSKSLAQNILYLQEIIPGKGIAFASDKGFTEAIGPRFGPCAAYMLTKENFDFMKNVVRTEQRMKQDNPVKYDIPFKDWNPLRFEAGNIGREEEDIWKALAFFEANPSIAGSNPEKSQLYTIIPPSGYLLQTDRVKHFVRGLALNGAANLLATGAFSGTDQPWQEAIMYCFAHNTVPANLPKDKYDGNYLQVIQEKFDRWKPVYDLWRRMILNGKNEPLRKLVNGARDWDFNIDGLAHYGMVPDLLQDLKNIGIRADQFVPLFTSVEQYIQMWEKANAASAGAMLNPKDEVSNATTGCKAITSSQDKTACGSYTSPSGKYTWTKSGTYKDTIENKSCCDSIITVNLNIFHLDTAVVIKDSVLFAHRAGANYQWINCKTRMPVTGATAQTFKPTDAETYALRINHDGCTGESSCYATRSGGPGEPVTGGPGAPIIRSPTDNTLHLPEQKFTAGRKIVAADRTNNAMFGSVCSIDGDMAVVGVANERFDVFGKNEMQTAGAVYVYMRNADSSWRQVQKIVSGDRAADDQFGYSVALSGNYLIVGAPYDRKDSAGNEEMVASGSVYVFEKNSTGSFSQIDKVSGSGRTPYRYFGYSVALDDKHFVVGSIGESQDSSNSLESTVNDAGGLFVYDRTATGWKETAKVVADSIDRVLGDNMGWSVGVSGDYIIAGAPGTDFGENNTARMETAGAAYIFHCDGKNWKQVKKLLPSDRTPYDEFGNSVSISGDHAVVGAWRTTLTDDEDHGGQTGTAYIFSNSGGAWKEEKILKADDRKEGDEFGKGVAINGDYVAIGCPSRDITESGEGAIYVYWNDGSKWVLSQKLVSPDQGIYAGMGGCVALTEGFVISGAINEHRDLSNKNELSGAGAGYIFERPTGLKSQSQLPKKFQ